MDFKESIGIFPNSISDEFCDHLVSIFNNEWNNHYIGIVGSGEVESQSKVSRDFNLIQYEQYTNEVNMLTQISNTKINEYILRYKDVPNLNTKACVFQNGTHYPVWQIQYYKKGGGYKSWHNERPNINCCNRHLVFMTYLNNVNDNGETEFFYQNLKIKPEKGLTLIWGTDWTFTHRGVPSKTETKYIATGHYHYDS